MSNDDKVEIQVMADALMWEEPSPVKGDKPLQLSEFKGWRGFIPRSVAEAKGRQIAYVEEDGTLRYPDVVEEAKGPDYARMKIDDLQAMVNAQPNKKLRQEMAMAISNAELLRQPPRQTLIEFLDAVLEDAN